MRKLIVVSLILGACGSKTSPPPTPTSADSVTTAQVTADVASVAVDDTTTVAPDDTVAVAADDTVTEVPEDTTAEPAPARRACIPNDGDAHPRQVEISPTLLAGTSTVRFATIDGHFTYDLATRVLTPVEAPPDSVVDESPSPLRKEDDDHVILCDADGHACAPLVGAVGDTMLLDEGSGLAFVADEKVARVFDRKTKKQLAQGDISHDEDTITNLRVAGPALVVGYNCDCIGGPPMNPGLFDKRTLKRRGTIAPGHTLHTDSPGLWPVDGDVWATLDAWGAAVLLQDLATGKLVGSVDLTGALALGESTSPSNLLSHGAVEATVMSPGKLAVFLGAGSFGEIVIVDLAHRSIAERQRLPFCDEVTTKPLTCVPATTPPAIDGDGVLGESVVACSTVGESRQCVALDLRSGALGSLDAPATVERSDDDISGEMIPTGPDGADLVAGLQEWRDLPDGTRGLLVSQADASAPAQAQVYDHATQTMKAKAVIGSKASPCATLRPLGLKVALVTQRACEPEGKSGDAWLVSSVTLKKLAPLGGDDAFARGKVPLVAGRGQANLAVAVQGGQQVVMQSPVDGAVGKSIDLGAGIAIDALYRASNGDVIVRAGLDLVRVDATSGEVTARRAITRCP